MSWVRRDDQASIHRKVAPLDDGCYRLWSEAIEWCSRNKTDGRIGAAELPEIKRGTPQRAAILVSRGLWHVAGESCASKKCPDHEAGGWVIHDYLDYNPSKAQTTADLEAKAERTARWRARKRSGDGPGDASQDTPVTRHSSVTRRARDGTGDGGGDAPVTLPRPVPPRPEGKRGRDVPEHVPPPPADAGLADGGPEDQTRGDPAGPNGRPVRPPAELVAEMRAQLRDAARNAHIDDRRRADPLAELRAATPDIPPLLEAEETTNDNQTNPPT